MTKVPVVGGEGGGEGGEREKSGKRLHPSGLLLLHPDERQEGYEVEDLIRVQPHIRVKWCQNYG